MPSIHIPPPWKLPERLATPEDVFVNRRQILAALGLGTIGMAITPALGCAAPQASEPAGAGAAAGTAPQPAAKTAPAVGQKFAAQFPAKRNASYNYAGRPQTAEDVAGTYNNFYEFSTTKDEVWKRAQGYSVDPWKIEIGGLVKQPRTLDLDDLFTRFPLEERLYRFRCVEAWAMQVPWTGFPLKALIDYCEPLGEARYVRFVSVLDKEHMPGQVEYSYYPFPYYESLRLDEATNPVAFVAVGSYGHGLPMQHGAPLRLALPWKYGYKGPKSPVKIEFTKERPGTFWNDLQPKEYGYFSNVNPEKPHPRWSQATERDIGTGERRPTLLYNGYGEQVAGMYDGKEV
jgi:sulfoxide reductase catalytic subunit YedY